ncbi:coxsackievirus and adenovirus receptor homolog [Carassius gibelio]|uniref:coxsackievirus and adenovirus receptor homolog n=1 Tax=Carassius gibelio TaxID=101364 RepID=UPI002279E4F5|nr:coxsackievirus and adenovirus receptor homolog [Carassius gibelio]
MSLGHNSLFSFLDSSVCLKNFNQLNGRKWHKERCPNMNVQKHCCNTRCMKQPCVRLTGLFPSSSFMILTALAMLSLKANVTAAMKVTSSGPQTLKMAQGEPVTLDCTYTSNQADIGELDIEWSIVSPDTTKKDQMIISYTGGRKYTHGDPDLMKGVDFTATDPSQGDASLTIASLTASHDGTYQCKVKKTPGVDSRKISLIVMASTAPNRAGVITGTVVGCLLLIMIILIIIWLLIFRCNWNRHEKEFSNDIREDVPAPESRPTSRISSFRSGVAYSQVGQTQNEHPLSTNTSYSTAKYDSKFGYAV